MTTYIALFNLTDPGIKAAKDSPRRLDAAKRLLADMGGEMKQFYLVMGEFDFVDAYNFARRLKTLRGLTPYEFVCKAWTSQPQRFTLARSRKCRD